jgi:histone H3/H4
MGDRDEVGLPKATMARAIKDRMPAEMRIGNDATELIVKCCEEFVRMISTTANELSEKDKKSTILPEHVLEALEKLGFHPYMEALHAGKKILGGRGGGCFTQGLSIYLGRPVQSDQVSTPYD